MRIFLLFFLLFGTHSLLAQSYEFLGTPTPCTSTIVSSVENVSNNGATWEVQNTNLPDSLLVPFKEAVKKWQGWLNSTQPVKIMVTMSQQTDEVLAGTESEFALINTWAGLRWHTAALARQLQPNVPFYNNLPDMCIHFNKTLVEQGAFYKGTDTFVPANKFDFLTLSLHEIAHGLGFSSSLRIFGALGLDASGGDAPCLDQRNIACFGFKAANGTVYPTKFDSFLMSNNQSLSNLNNIIDRTNPSLTLYNLLTQGGLYYYNTTSPSPGIYAPNTYFQGSSLNHWQGNITHVADELMAIDLNKGVAIHAIGEGTCAMLFSLGWSTSSNCGKYAYLKTDATIHKSHWSGGFYLEPVRISNQGNVPLVITGYTTTNPNIYPNSSVTNLTIAPNSFADLLIRVNVTEGAFDGKITFHSNSAIRKTPSAFYLYGREDIYIRGHGYYGFGEAAVSLDFEENFSETFYVGQEATLTPTFALSNEYPNLIFSDFILEVMMPSDMFGQIGTLPAYALWSEYGNDCTFNVQPQIWGFALNSTGQSGCQKREGMLGRINFTPKKAGIYPITMVLHHPAVRAGGGIRYIKVEHLCGDVNEDGKVDDLDISMTADALLGNTILSTEQQFAANVSGNTTLSAQDLSLLFTKKKGGPALNGCAIPNPFHKNEPQDYAKTTPSFNIQLPHVISGRVNDIVYFDVKVPTGIGRNQVEALSLALESNPTYLELLDIETKGTLSDSTFSISKKEGNTLKVILASPQVLTGQGTLFKVKAKIKSLGASSGLAFAAPIALGESPIVQPPPPIDIPVQLDTEQPNQIGLISTYPNPFSAKLQVQFVGALGTETQIHLYNILGQKVATLYEGLSTGTKQDANFENQHLANGVYILRMQSGTYTQQMKIVLQR